MDENTSNDEKVPVICPVCEGTGFGKPGEICPCISGEELDVLGFLKSIFNMEPKPK